MKLFLRKEALEDMNAIIDYFQDVAPEIQPKIIADIQRAFDIVQRYPKIGMMIDGYPLRRIVTRKYRFKIAYQAGTDTIVVFGIFRHQDRQY